MSLDRAFRRLAAGFALTLAVALAIAACAGATPTASTSIGPTLSIAPTPSPTPVDVSTAFLEIVSAPGFTAAAKVSGTVSIGMVDGEISGFGTFRGPDSSGTFTIVAGNVKQVSQSVSIGNQSWTRKDSGPWLEDEDESPESNHGMGDVLTEIVAVTDLGVETHAGRQLHHLQPKGGNKISADALGFDVASATEAKFTLDLYATDDGTPAIMAVTGGWTQGSGDAALPITFNMELALSDVGKTQTIRPPDDVWVRYISRDKGYTMAHPANMTVESTLTKDSYVLNGQGYVYAVIQPFEGSTAKFVTELKAAYKAQIGVLPTSESPTTLGGEAAARLTYEHTTDTGQALSFVDDVISHNGIGWEVFGGISGPADIAAFDIFVGTFAFIE